MKHVLTELSMTSGSWRIIEERISQVRLSHRRALDNMEIRIAGGTRCITATLCRCHKGNHVIYILNIKRNITFEF